MKPARIVGIILLLLPSFAHGKGDAEMCNIAAIDTARNAEIPPDVLLALTLVETGRSKAGKFAPWPWTVNMEGKGYWFGTRVEAIEFVTESYTNGARSFDVGCFQINHRWHGQAFASFSQMFDPAANAAYAAKFMTSLYDEGGSWSWAAGAYHSRTTALAAKYRSRFDRIFAGLDDHPEALELPVVVAANDVPSTSQQSTWDPFQPIDMTSVPVSKGSLAGGLLTRSASPLLGAPTRALF